MRIRSFLSLLAIFTVVSLSWSQEYQPKFSGDPAKSDSEAAALGFMRTVVNAEKNYKTKHNVYAPSLQSLVGTGSITKRMVESKKRGDYTVSFAGTAESYHLTMMPDTIDATHRAFFVDQSGKIKAEEDKPATDDSPAV